MNKVCTTLIFVAFLVVTILLPLPIFAQDKQGSETQEVEKPDLSGPGCHFLKQTMKMGDIHNDPIEVAKLQYFLKTYENIDSLLITGFFDKPTYDAVSFFQKKYAQDILSPWGYSIPTGFVYTLTKKKINEIVCGVSFNLSSLEQAEIDAVKSGTVKNPIVGMHIQNVPTTKTTIQGEIFAEGEISSTSTIAVGVEESHDIVVTLEPELIAPRENVAVITDQMTHNAEGVVNSTVFNAWDSFVHNERIRGLAAAVVTIPEADDFFNGSILFIIILLLLNILSSVTKQQKHLVFLLGSVCALAITFFFKAYYFFLPFVVVMAISILVFIRDLWFSETQKQDPKKPEQALAHVLPMTIVKIPKE